MLIEHEVCTECHYFEIELSCLLSLSVSPSPSPSLRFLCFTELSFSKLRTLCFAYAFAHTFFYIIYIQLDLSWEKQPLLFKSSGNIFHFISMLPHVARYIFKFLTKLSHSNISFSDFTRNFQW